MKWEGYRHDDIPELEGVTKAWMISSHIFAKTAGDAYPQK
jgi:hypothetical protein